MTFESADYVGCFQKICPISWNHIVVKETKVSGNKKNARRKCVENRNDTKPAATDVPLNSFFGGLGGHFLDEFPNVFRFPISNQVSVSFRF